MKKIKSFVEKIKNKTNEAICETAEAVKNNDGEFFIDKGVAIIIVLAVGVIVLGLMLTAWKTTILPNLATKITEMFSAT